MLTGIVSGIISALLMSGSYIFSRAYFRKHNDPLRLAIHSQFNMLFWGILGLQGTLLLGALLLGQILALALNSNGCAIHDLMAGTVVVDISSQMIFRTTEDLIAYKKKIHAENVSRQSY